MAKSTGEYMFFGNKPDWPIDQAKKSVGNNKGFFVDVREDFEVETAHVKDTIWVPLGRLMSQTDEVIQKLKDDYGADKEFYIYCRSGNRSAQAQIVFNAHGLAAHNVGGLVDLEQNDVSMAGGIPTKVI